MKDYQIKAYKEAYPPGTRVEIISMDDPQAVPCGTKGTVKIVDDVGTIHVNWDNGSSLGICPDEDQFRRVEAPVVQRGAPQKNRAARNRDDAR